MKVEVEKLPKSKIKIRFDAPVEMVDRYIDEAYKELSRDITIPGFRPGYAPRHMVESRVGSDAINNKAVEMLFPFIYAEAITQEKIMAIGKPEVNVKKFAPGNPAEFEAEVAVLPEVKLPDYKKLKIKEEKVSVNEEEIEKVVGNMLKKEAKLEPKSGKAQIGDWAEIDFAGEKNGVKLERLMSKNHPFVIGEGTLLLDFEKNIVDMTEGEEKVFDLVFPNDYNDKELAGSQVKFTVKLNKLQKLITPELNDDFVQKITRGNIKTVTAFKEDVRKAVENQKKQEERMRQEEELLTQVVENSTIDLPESLIEDEMDQMKINLENKLESQGLKLDKYLEYTKKTEENLKTELRKEAERKIKLGLILNKIAEEEEIEVSEEEREKEVAKAKEDAYKKNIDDFKEEETRRYITVILKHRKAVEKLLEYATS